MSSIGETVLRSMVQLKERVAPQLASSVGGDSFESYFLWQHESSDRTFAQYPHFSPQGKTILEIGCGTGGRTAWLAGTGATRVVGIDINAEEIHIAKELVARKFPQLLSGDAPVLEYYVSQETARLDIGEFDYVVLVDAMEHVVSPPAILRLAYDYLKTGGICYFNTIGWFHHKGSHLPLVPWSNLLFSDETVLNVMRWKVSQPGYQPSRFDSQPPIQRWLGIYDLRDRPGEYLNKITIHKIKKLCRHSIFREAHWTTVGFRSRNPIARVLNLAKDVPIVQEVFHSGIVVDLKK